MEKLYFTGHETFHCRSFWLKKGYDFIKHGHAFNKDEAVLHLGVGKNMVSSIRFWLKAFNLLDEDGSVNSSFANKIFSDDTGFDPYLEDVGTIWMLHYLLVTQKRSSIYYLVFNEFRKYRLEFTKEHLQSFIERYCRTRGIYFNSSSVSKDINVFLNNYLPPSSAKKGIEDNFAGLLYELGLVRPIEKPDVDRKGKRREWYRIENTPREDLPYEIVLFCILDNEKYGNSITFTELLNDKDSVGSVFALTSQGLMKKLEQVIQHYPKKAVFTDDGGIRVLQFKERIDKWEILNRYYEE